MNRFNFNFMGIKTLKIICERRPFSAITASNISRDAVSYDKKLRMQELRFLYN